MATKASSKKDNIQIAEIQARTHIVVQFVGLIRTGLVGFAVYGCVQTIVEGLKSIVQASPDAISALAKVVENFHLSGIVGSLVGLAGVSYGVFERRGKKRLLAGYDQQRRSAEKNDPYHASSGLTESGDTPK